MKLLNPVFRSTAPQTPQPLEKWREGVMTHMRMSILAGERQLCIFDQFCETGSGAPPHLHEVEEVLEVMEGTAEGPVGQKKSHTHGKPICPDPCGHQSWVSQSRSNNIARPRDTGCANL